MVLNPCEREIDLLCLGLRIPDDVPLGNARGLSRTRAGLGSGLELAIPTTSWLKRKLWVNVPVLEDFAKQSPYVLGGSADSGGHFIADERSGHRIPVDLPEEPAWYRRLTSREIPMKRIGVLQGTYLGIYINPVCAFWSYDPPLNCQFCTTGQNVGEHESVHKSVSDVVETCWAARDESAVTFVHLNGGFQGSQGIRQTEPYVQAIKEKVGMLVGVQLTPERDFSRYDRLVDLGVDHLSFCVEFRDPAWFERMCPGKARMLGQRLFFDSIEYCARRLPRGAASGEIIAGIEPIERTMQAIDEITAMGAFPTVCIFRPTRGSNLQDWPSPRYEDMRAVMAYVYDACRRHWLPIGAAPNIEVSLVVNPDDAAFLSPRTMQFYAYEAFRRTARWAARPLFRRRMRPRRRKPGATPGIPPRGISQKTRHSRDFRAK